ncbi:MAG: vitamin K epoxide reductase family protein [Candidatus Omnitrophica bacterium]|nr:vitamin K epoxide reductase family protein [Candidatus Omnitrophota bacterium]
MTSVAVLGLSLAGLWISVYFTGVYYRWFSPDVFWVPQVCRLDEKSCLNVLQTPRAKLFGIPNSAFGIGIYSYLALSVFILPPWPGFALLGAALVRSAYLAHSLIFVTKIPCRLCFASHGINLILFLIYAGQVF